MNDKLTQLLEQLANKLGTTAEYLWRILLVQARVSATESLIYVVFVAISGVILYRCHMKFSKRDENSDLSYYDTVYRRSEATAYMMSLLAVIWGLALSGALFAFYDIITGYFNPEYWALREILNSI